MNGIAIAYLIGGVSAVVCAVGQPDWAARITLVALAVVFAYAAGTAARRGRQAAHASGAAHEASAGMEADSCAMESRRKGPQGKFHAPAADRIGSPEDGAAWMKEPQADVRLQARRRRLLDSLAAGGCPEFSEPAPEGLLLEAGEALLHAWGVRLHRAVPPAEGAEAARTAHGFAAASGISGKAEERVGLRSMGHAVAALTTKRLYLLSLTAPRKLSFSDIVYLRPLENGVLIGIANEGALFIECALSGTQERDFFIGLVKAAMNGSAMQTGAA